MKLIFEYIKRHWISFLLSTMFLTLEAAADLLQPTFMSHIVDRGIKNADVDQILHYGLIMLCIAAVGAAGALMRNYFSVRTSQTVALELRRDMYRSVQRLSLENIDVLQPAGIITRITNDVTQIQEFINSMMRMMVKAPITCIGAVALIIMQTPRQAPVLIVIIIIVGFLILGNVKIGYPRFGRVQKKLDALNAAAREFLSSVRVVKAFNAEEAEKKKFNAASGELAAANTSALHANALFNPLINLAVNMGIVVLLYISRSQNAGEIGKLMASVNYMTQVLFALTRIANVINVAVRAMASSARIQEVFDEKPAQPRAESPLSPEIRGNIKFDNVSFAYAISAKERFIGVPAAIIDKYGVVSAETAAAMAEGVRKTAGSDIGISVTGIAGPTGAEPGKPVGTVWMGVCRKGAAADARLLTFRGDREQVRLQTVLAALEAFEGAIGD